MITSCPLMELNCSRPVFLCSEYCIVVSNFYPLRVQFYLTSSETPLVVRSEVKNIQIRLNYLGFNAGSVDGKYGNVTRLAVEAFQRSFRRVVLVVDGIAGRQTKEALSYPAGS